MKIAVLGWGSLIWSQGLLRLKSRWHRDGPLLPVEFARASKGDRVTLVLVPESRLQPTFWAVSGFEELDPALANLRVREGNPPARHIHWCMPETEAEEALPAVSSTLRRWLLSQGLDAAVWTGLPPKWAGEVGRRPNPVEVITHLRGLIASGKAAPAEEYVRKTPREVDTEVRARVAAELGWHHTPLSPALFEDASTSE